MTASSHARDTFVRADRQRVWRALVDPELTVGYFVGARIDSSFRVGAPVRYVLDDGDVDVVEGVIETCDAPHRLVMTWRVLDDAEAAGEPASRVEWTLTPEADGAVTRVTMRHLGLALSPRTWELARLRWVRVLDVLKTLLETGEALPPVDDSPAAVDVGEIEGNWHRAQAVIANNSVWELLDGRELSGDQADDLLQRAYAAAYHWARASGATVINRARAAWLVSRAHAVLGHGELALTHADRCARLVEQAVHDADDHDHAYVYESRARALACLGRLPEAREAYRRARSVDVSDPQDRALVEADLAAGPWYGLDRS